MSGNQDLLRFPVGIHTIPDSISSQTILNDIAILEIFPEQLRREAEHLNALQLDTHYRPGGWTIRQVVHHCADSHMNSFIRFKLALTEQHPDIKPYEENEWAKLEDSKQMPVEPSLMILDGLHKRWVTLIKSLKPEEMKRTFIHPEHGKIFRIDETIGIYAWHCKHHLAHITTLKTRMGWI